MNRLEGLGKAIFYISFPISFIGFILPIYASNMGANPLEVGLLYSVFSLCSILIRPIVGFWIDKKGRKSGFVLGLLFYLVVTGLFLIGNGYKYILVARIMQSIATSFIWISVYTIVSDVSNDSCRSRNIGIIDQFANKGEIVGSFIGFTILFNDFLDEPFKYIFMIYFVTSLIGLYYGITKTEETLVKKEDRVEQQLSIDSQFIKFLVIMSILSLATSMLAPIYLIYLKEHITKDLALISFLFLPGAILSVFLPKKFGILSDKHGRKRILVIGVLLQAVFVVLIPLIKNYYVFMLIYTKLSLCSMLRLPAQTALVIDITGGEKRGKNYGLYSFATGLGGIIGPLLGSLIYQCIGKSIVFYVQGIVLVFEAIAINLLIKGKKELTNYNVVIE